MRTDNYFDTNRDLTFYYEKVIDWDRLVPLYAEPDDAMRPAETAASWREALSVAGDYIGHQVSARAVEVDRLGTPHKGDIKVSPPMAENLRGLADLGLIGLGVPREYGGEGMPFVVHSAVLETLARAGPGSTGLDGLALFLVPRCIPDSVHGERQNFAVERAEEKVCINGSPTCALSFDDSYAEIMGSPGEGWHHITTFMNEARID